MMKPASLPCLLLALLSWSSLGLARELPHCEDLIEIADLLRGVALELKENGRLEAEGNYATALAEIIAAFSDLGKVKDYQALAAAIKELRTAKERSDWEAVTAAVDKVIAELDPIRKRKCG